MRLARNESVELTIEKRGCRAQTVRLESRATAEGNTNLAGNLLLGGFIGAAVDAGNGANRDLLPNPVGVTLSC